LVVRVSEYEAGAAAEQKKTVQTLKKDLEAADKGFLAEFQSLEKAYTQKKVKDIFFTFTD
jgi:hypothetical protein